MESSLFYIVIIFRFVDIYMNHFLLVFKERFGKIFSQFSRQIEFQLIAV